MLASDPEKIEAAHPTLNHRIKSRREGDGEGEDANEERGKGVSRRGTWICHPAPGWRGGCGGRPTQVPERRGGRDGHLACAPGWRRQISSGQAVGTSGGRWAARQAAVATAVRSTGRRQQWGIEAVCGWGAGVRCMRVLPLAEAGADLGYRI
jgi:hypothetical protein